MEEGGGEESGATEGGQWGLTFHSASASHFGWFDPFIHKNTKKTVHFTFCKYYISCG